jgi:hypothetical protein
MSKALSKLLYRYPGIQSGVNRYEARLLASTRVQGPSVARIIAYSMKDSFVEDEECVGDNWLFWRMRRLADATVARPAITLSGNQTTIRGTEARLTRDGERFLSGELNFVDLNGIEDWVGGVRLDSRAGSVWFHRDKEIVRG